MPATWKYFHILLQPNSTKLKLERQCNWSGEYFFETKRVLQSLENQYKDISLHGHYNYVQQYHTCNDNFSLTPYMHFRTIREQGLACGHPLCGVMEEGDILIDINKGSLNLGGVSNRICQLKTVP